LLVAAKISGMQNYLEESALSRRMGRNGRTAERIATCGQLS
jgi:hypothetical protein